MRFLVMICSIILVLGMTESQSLAATKHGCAPVNPPAVSPPLTPLPAQSNEIFINEVLPLPSTHIIWYCPGTGTPPSIESWIELYNPNDQAFDLYSARASFDNGPGTRIFPLPVGSAIAAHGFLVIFSSNLGNLSLGNASDLRLMVGDVVIDQVTVPQLTPDYSYARMPDGGANWQIASVPTIDASNITIIPTTPTPTPKPTPTPRPTATPRPLKGSTGIYGDGTTSGSTGQTKPGDGEQPAWNGMQLPGDASPSTDAATPEAVSTAPATTNTADSMDMPRKILITVTVSVIALALALFWLYRRFKAT